MHGMRDLLSSDVPPPLQTPLQSTPSGSKTSSSSAAASSSTSSGTKRPATSASNNSQQLQVRGDFI